MNLQYNYVTKYVFGEILFLIKILQISFENTEVCVTFM